MDALTVAMGRFLSVAAAIRPVSVYGPGAMDTYTPPAPALPYATPLLDSAPVPERIAVIFVSSAWKFTAGAPTPKLKNLMREASGGSVGISWTAFLSHADSTA